MSTCSPGLTTESGRGSSPQIGPTQWRWQGPRKGPRKRQREPVVAGDYFPSAAGYVPSTLPSLPRVASGRVPELKSAETARVQPLLGLCRQPAAPRLTLYGGGGTNQRATSPFRFKAPDARLTPRPARALIGCERRRSSRVGGAAEGKGRRGGSGPRLSAPRSPPALPLALGLLPSLLRSLHLLCARSALLGRRSSRPNRRVGAPISGRQGASPGAAPANRRGPRWEAGLAARPRRRRSSSPASSQRAPSGPPGAPSIPFGRGKNKRSRTPGSDGAGPGAPVQVR